MIDTATNHNTNDNNISNNNDNDIQGSSTDAASASCISS